MKLIINIPQTAYDAIQALKDIESTNEGTLENVLIKAVESGIPLDKIRTKIKRYRDTIDRAIAEDSSKIEGMKEAYNDCLEIIDSYREGEQE